MLFTHDGDDDDPRQNSKKDVARSRLSFGEINLLND